MSESKSLSFIIKKEKEKQKLVEIIEINNISDLYEIGELIG